MGWLFGKAVEDGVRDGVQDGIRKGIGGALAGVLGPQISWVVRQTKAVQMARTAGDCEKMLRESGFTEAADLLLRRAVVPAQKHRDAVLKEPQP